MQLERWENLYALPPEPQLDIDQAMWLAKLEMRRAEDQLKRATENHRTHKTDVTKEEFETAKSEFEEASKLFGASSDRPDEAFWADPKMEELRAELNAEIAAVESARVALEREKSILESASAEDVTADFSARVAALVPTKIQLLHRESSVRLRVEKEWQGKAINSRSRYRAKVETIAEWVKSDLRRKLISIGYPDGLIEGTNALAIIPDFFVRHPGCRQASGYAQAAMLAPNSTEAFQHNRAAIERVNAIIQTEIRRMSR